MLCLGVALQNIQPELGKSIVHIVQKKAKELHVSDNDYDNKNIFSSCNTIAGMQK